MTETQDWSDWRDAEGLDWPLTHFSPAELSTAHSNQKRDMLLRVHWPSAKALDALRASVGHSIILHSAYRSPDHNRRVRGHPNSRHLHGRAFDISLSSIRDMRGLLTTAHQLGFVGFGFYNRFVHIDTGPKQRAWDGRDDQSKPHMVPWALAGS